MKTVCDNVVFANVKFHTIIVMCKCTEKITLVPY